MNIRKALEDMGRDEKVRLLEESRSTGEPIAKVIGKYFLPEMAILDDNMKFSYEGKMITVAEWEKLNPLGEYGRIVVIGTDDELERLKNTN